MRRIDAAERDKQVLVDGDTGSRNWLNQLLPWLFGRMHYAGASLAVIVGVFILAPNLMTSNDADFGSAWKTLTDEVDKNESVSEYQRVVITFSSDAENDIVRETLIKTHAKIIQSNEAENSYVVDLEVPSSRSVAEFYAQISELDSVISVVAVANP
jgi:hypothetical protein